jgi:two-component system response regulator LytT
MRILIVEDEYPTAEDLKFILCDLLKERITTIKIETSLQNALFHLEEKQIDILFLDLNLNGKDGFTILQEAASKSFYTIVVSANSHRAIEAFEYGVLDFIPKPYTIERIEKALERIEGTSVFFNKYLKYLPVKENNKIKIIPLEQIRYFKGANIYVELFLENGTRQICDKTMTGLCKILPPNYIRIHKSYILDKNQIVKLFNYSAGKYEVELKSGEILPVGRFFYKDLKDYFDNLTIL